MLRILGALLSLAFTSVLSCAVAWAAEPVLVVELVSGRRFAGAIDAASSAEELVLRSGGVNMALRRPIRWERIVRARLDGQPVALGELQLLAAAERSRESGVGGQETGNRGQGTGELSPSDLLPAPVPVAVELAGPADPVPLPQVRSVTFEARIANWDADVETDGLLVDLLPLDGEGFLVPARGTVEVELFASQRRDFSAAPLAGGDTLERVDRWTRAVDPADFTSRGGRLKLPFGAVHPEFDSRWLAHYYGLVHVRFASPGQGVFEASQDGLRIRPYAPLRDRLELYNGRRFLPTERTGRGISSAANER